MKSFSNDFKIITTIGPTSASIDIIKKLVKAGATTFRINLSHSSINSLEQYYSLIESANVIPSIDTQGPQVRIVDSKVRTLPHLGETIRIGYYKDSGKFDFDISVNHLELFSQVQVEDQLKIGFDGLVLSIDSISKNSDLIIANVIATGNVSSNSALDVTNRDLKLNSLTNFDISAIRKYVAKGLEYVFLSFTNNERDIIELSKIISDCQTDLPKPKIIAKIESIAGMKNLDQILPIVNGILIDRGDLSREVSISRIPMATIYINNKCKLNNVPCYVATNVLDSMINAPLPSRAEISDLFNIYELGVSGIVLAAEVAIGKYPVECVHVVNYMHTIYQNSDIDDFFNMQKFVFNNELPNELKYWL